MPGEFPKSRKMTIHSIPQDNPGPDTYSSMAAMKRQLLDQKGPAR